MEIAPSKFSGVISLGVNGSCYECRAFATSLETLILGVHEKFPVTFRVILKNEIDDDALIDEFVQGGLRYWLFVGFDGG